MGTKACAVAKINNPKIIDLVVAAPTNPVMISKGDKGAA